MNGKSIFVALIGILGAMQVARADMVTDWNDQAVAMLAVRPLPSPVADRIMAMMHVAIFDAVNAVEPRYRPYLQRIAIEAPVSKEAAAAAAAAAVLAGLRPDAAVEVDAQLTASLSAIAEGPEKASGVKLGKTAAERILAARANDGAGATDTYRPKTKPGVYIPTPLTATSTWPGVKPFAMQSGSQFRPPPPIALTSAQWIADYNEIKKFGSRNSTERSARQTEDARFWLMVGPVSYYPMARQLVAQKHMSLLDSARFLALVSVAIEDSYIAVMDAKYTYEFWRPVTAIRNGDQMRNSAMARDAAWLPLGETPMHPEYPCAHCIASGAFASVVETLFGSADVPELSMTSPTAPGVTHHWTNIRAYTNEVSEARIWAGFHYRFSTRVGQEMGRKIGQHVARSVMQPI